MGPALDACCTTVAQQSETRPEVKLRRFRVKSSGKISIHQSSILFKPAEWTEAITGKEFTTISFKDKIWLLATGHENICFRWDLTKKIMPSWYLPHYTRQEMSFSQLVYINISTQRRSFWCWILWIFVWSQNRKLSDYLKNRCYIKERRCYFESGSRRLW